jgi:hypothetical protein
MTREIINKQLFRAIDSFNSVMGRKTFSKNELRGILYNCIRKEIKNVNKIGFQVNHLEILMDNNVLCELFITDKRGVPDCLAGIRIKCQGARTREMLEILEIVNSIK